jgi:hypothetical protein
MQTLASLVVVLSGEGEESNEREDERERGEKEDRVGTDSTNWET